MVKNFPARTAVASFIADAVLTVLFVAIGRSTHHGAVFGPWARDLFSTAWPFLVAFVAGWVLLRSWQRPTALLRVGVPLWLITVVGGLSLRAVTGEGLALPFILVAATTLLTFLVGWRVLFLAFQKVRR